MTLNNIWLTFNFLTLIFVLFANAGGTYVEHSKLQLITLILIQIIFISLNKHLNNKLLALLNLHVLCFYTARIPFLFSNSLLSDVIMRNVEITQISSSLLYLNIEIVVFSTIIILFKPLNNFFNVFINFKLIKNTNSILIFTMIIIILNMYVIITFWFYKNILDNVFISISLAILNLTAAQILLLALIISTKSSHLLWARIQICVQLFISAIVGSLNGSKSAVLQILELLILSIIISYGSNYYINLRKFIYLLLFILSSFIGYLTGHYINHLREYLMAERISGSQIKSVVDAVNTMSLSMPSSPVQSFGYRIGYLDFYIDKVTQQIYLKAFDFHNYLKAVLDGLTPGFNIWGDVPLVSRAVFNSYFGPSAGPNSEAITVFAEAHILMGHYSAIIYFGVLLLVYLFGKLCMSFSRSEYEKFAVLLFTGFCFEQYLSGFGLDYWFMANFVYLAITVYASFLLVRFLSFVRHPQSCR